MRRSMQRLDLTRTNWWARRRRVPITPVFAQLSMPGGDVTEVDDTVESLAGHFGSGGIWSQMARGEEIQWLVRFSSFSPVNR